MSETGGGRPPLRFGTRRGLIGVFHGPPAADDGSPALRDCTVVDGMNTAGLVFNVLAYPDAGGPQPARVVRDPALNVIDFGLWALGQFASVAEVRAALDTVPFLLEPLAGLGVQPPFHYSLYDRSGAALVVEFHKGELSLYDNPVGVMTNGPQFSWHLVNINNYAHLSNRDRSAGRLGRLELRQPDAGISMAGLPSDTTSVGRFVRAAYFASFAEKAADPDAAVRTLGHIMNNFDRGARAFAPRSRRDRQFRRDDGCVRSGKSDRIHNLDPAFRHGARALFHARLRGAQLHPLRSRRIVA